MGESNKIIDGPVKTKSIFYNTDVYIDTVHIIHMFAYTLNTCMHTHYTLVCIHMIHMYVYTLYSCMLKHDTHVSTYMIRTYIINATNV